MECRHCHGFMVRDHVFDLLSTDIHGEVWRCVCCGDIIDQVILVNRRRKAAKTLMGKVRMPNHWSNSQQRDLKIRKELTI